jgi:hypothetical protein
MCCLVLINVCRYYLRGPKAGQTDVFVDNLPGLPDNISPNARGNGYWVPFAVTRMWITEYMVELPALRSLVVRVRPPPLCLSLPLANLITVFTILSDGTL